VYVIETELLSSLTDLLWQIIAPSGFWGCTFVNSVLQYSRELFNFQMAKGEHLCGNL
jgi:hypothetical protein